MDVGSRVLNKYEWLDGYLLMKPGASKNLQKDWNWIRYALADKMFVALCLDEDDEAQYITLKLNPDNGIALRDKYSDIIPGYYMNKKHWNSIKVDGNIKDDLLKELLDESYDLVLSGFSRKKQQEILSG